MSAPVPLEMIGDVHGLVANTSMGRESRFPDGVAEAADAWAHEDEDDSDQELDITVTEAFFECEDPDQRESESDDPALIPEFTAQVTIADSSDDNSSGELTDH